MWLAWLIIKLATISSYFWKTYVSVGFKSPVPKYCVPTLCLQCHFDIWPLTKIRLTLSSLCYCSTNKKNKSNQLKFSILFLGWFFLLNTGIKFWWNFLSFAAVQRCYQEGYERFRGKVWSFGRARVWIAESPTTSIRDEERGRTNEVGGFRSEGNRNSSWLLGPGWFDLGFFRWLWAPK